jgi:hypothetical protein
MSRSVGIVCAVALLTAGCLRDVLAPGRAAPGTQTVSASMNVVSELLQQGLCDLGVVVREKSEPEEVKLAGLTRSGKVFCLRVRPEKVEGRPRSVVTIVWDGEADEAFWGQVLQILAPVVR